MNGYDRLTAFKSDFLNLLNLRGYFHQCTNLKTLDEVMSSQSIPVYIGFDCTAKSLHIGSLMQIMVLRYLQKFGHKPIILLGGGTTKIGDPSGKDKSRTMLSADDIIMNMQGIRAVLEKFISFGSGRNGSFTNFTSGRQELEARETENRNTNENNAIIANNADWLNELNYIEFLRNIGSHFSINRMLSFDSVKLRLEREQNLSFLEFNYMLLQAYDFTELNRRYQCRLQIGGSDQWGNIVNGVELGRKLNLPELFGLTTPLLLTSSGEKMGKTAGGAIWLDGDMCSPYDYWQYFRNVADSDVGRFLRLFTELPITEIEKLEALTGQEINEAKKILATEVTKICHGQEVADKIANAAIKIFEQNDNSELPVFELEQNKVVDGISLIKLLQLSGLETSGSNARRLIKDGGCKINDVTIEEMNTVLSVGNFNSNGCIKLSCGKKRHVKILLI